MYRRTVLSTVGAGVFGGVGAPTADGRARTDAVPDGYERRWDLPVESATDRMLVSGSRVFVVGQRARAYDSKDGSIVWKSDTAVRPGPAPSAHDGALYVLTEAGALVGFEPSGERSVDHDLGTDDVDFCVHRPTSSLVVLDGSRLLAVRPDDGATVWEHDLGGSLTNGSVEQFGRDPAVAVRSVDRQALVRVADGTIQWERDLFTSSNSVALSRNRVYLDHDGLVALDRETGERAWGADLGVLDVETDRQGVIVRTPDGVAAVSADGDRRWQVALGQLPDRWRYNPIVGPRRVYVLDPDDGGLRLRALDLDDGMGVWGARVTSDLPENLAYTEPALSPQGVYAGGGTTMVATRMDSGEVTGRFAFDSPVVWRPTVTDDGLFVRTHDRVHAFDRPACSVPSVEDGDARYVFPVPGPRSLEVSARFGGVDCTWNGTMTVLATGATAGTVPITLTPQDTTLDTTIRDVELPDGLDSVTLVVSAPDGTVLERSSIPLTYDDEGGSDVVEPDPSTTVVGGTETSPARASRGEGGTGAGDLWLYGVGGVGVVASIGGAYWWYRRE